MSGIAQKPKLLIVDTSPAMAQVLSNYAQQENYQADVYSDPADACIALDKQTDDYHCVVLGWPEGKLNIIADLLSKLSEAEFARLPMVLVSQEDSAVAATLAKRRNKTRMLLWKDYRKIAGLIEGLVDSYIGTDANSPAAPAPGILLVSHTRADCRELVDQLVARDYQVTQSSNLEQAKAALKSSPFDLVVADYNLHGSTGKDLSDYLNSLNPRPVYAFMADDKLDEAVQASLALGAITCLDKTAPADTLSARLDAIVGGLSPREKSAVIQPTKDQTFVPIAGMLEMASGPALLLNNGQQIIAANKQAMSIVAPGESEEIFKTISATHVPGDWLNLAQTEPANGKFSSISGDQFAVEYQIKKLDGASLGIEGDRYLLTFNVLESVPAQTPPAVAPEAPPAVSSVPAILSSSEMERAIDRAVLRRKAGWVVSLLMLDIKMNATVTGDRLSLGSSQPLLDIFKENFLQKYPKENSLAYLGKGRFALLIETQKVEQALNLSKKIVYAVPDLVNSTGDLQLVTHAAFLRMPEHSSMTPDLLLRHCAAACLKTEMDGQDNFIYVIGEEPWQKSAGSQESEVEGTPVWDLGIPDMPVSSGRQRELL